MVALLLLHGCSLFRTTKYAKSIAQLNNMPDKIITILQVKNLCQLITWLKQVGYKILNFLLLFCNQLMLTQNWVNSCVVAFLSTSNAQIFCLKFERSRDSS